MPRIQRSSLICLVLSLPALLFGCGTGSGSPASPQSSRILDPSPLSQAMEAGSLRFDPALSPKQRGAFVTAIEYLDRLESLDADPRLLSLLKIRTDDGPALRAWIEDRVQYILPEEARLSGRYFSVLERNYRYDHPEVLPPASRTVQMAAAALRGTLVMSNLGVSAYLAGKKRRILLGLKAAGRNLAITSPRAGVLRAGNGLFLLPPQAPFAVRASHIATLIHEARHSDGNRESTGFLHSRCVEGDMAGEAACDHNTNGPYVIEAIVLQAFVKSCSAAACPALDRKLLQTLYADIAQRQILDAKTVEWDDTPEGRRL